MDYLPGQQELSFIPSPIKECIEQEYQDAVRALVRSYWGRVYLQRNEPQVTKDFVADLAKLEECRARLVGAL